MKRFFLWAVVLLSLLSVPVSGAVSLTRAKNDYIAANSTDSPNAFPGTTNIEAQNVSWGAWVYIEDADPNESRALIDLRPDSGTSQATHYHDPNGRITLTVCDQAGGEGVASVSYGPLSAGWHWIGASKTAASNLFLVVNGSNRGSVANDNCPNVAMTRLQLGRTVGGARSLNCKLASYVVADYAFSTQDKTDIYSGGTDPDRKLTLSSTVKCWALLQNTLYEDAGDVGSVRWDCGVEPTFADDSALFVTAGYTAPAIASVPATRHLEDIYWNLPTDFVYAGDSFAYAYDKDAPAMPFYNAFCRLTEQDPYKLFLGSNSTNQLNGNAAFFSATSGGADPGWAWQLWETHGSQYEIELQGTPDKFYALPLAGGHELWTGSAPATAATACRIAFQPLSVSYFDSGQPMYDWCSAALSVQLVYRQPSENGMASVTLRDFTDTGSDLTVDLETPAITSHVNATPPIICDADNSGLRWLYVLPPGGSWSGQANKYLEVAGTLVKIAAHAGGPGLITHTDGSWSWVSYTQNEAGDSANDKTYSDEQYIPWGEIMFGQPADAGRRIVWLHRLAYEDLSEANYATYAELTVDRYQTLHDAQGWAEPTVVFVLPQTHSINGKMWMGRRAAERAARALNTLADSDDRVKIINEYKLTGGCSFDPNQSTYTSIPNDANGAVQQWIDTNAPGLSRSLLDSAHLHLATQEGGIYFGELEAAAIFEHGSEYVPPPLERARNIFESGVIR